MSNREFLSQMWGEISGNVTIAFATGLTPTGKLKVDEYHWFRYPEQFEQIVAFADAPQKGYRRNKYFSPHAYGDEIMRDTDGSPILYNGETRISRSTTNSKMVQVIAIDSDALDWRRFRAEPSIHVETSPGHGHDHFVLTEPVDSKRAAKLSRQMVEAHRADGIDVSAWAANKMMRLAEAENTKDTRNPWTITSFETNLIYTIEELEALYADVVVKKAAISSHSTFSEMQEHALPDALPLLQKIPSTERRLHELIYKDPKLGDQGWRSEQRWALLTDLIRFGFDAKEATAVAWTTPAARKWKEDGAGRGVGGLYGEAIKAEIEVRAEEAERRSISAAPDPVAQLGELETEFEYLTLLNPTERTKVKARLTVDQFYYQFIADRVVKSNMPYHRNAFAVYLASAFGDIGYVPRKDGKMPLNIYTFSMGTSSSGKSQADNFFNMWTSRLYPDETNMYIASDSSKNAFLEQLLERRSKAAIFNVDEADGLMAELISKAGGTVGLMQVMMKTYDGKLTGLGRVGQADLRIPHDAWVSLSDKLFGTPTGLMKVLTRDMFLTGFLARHMWAVGDRSVTTKEMMREDQVEGDIEATYESMPTFFAQIFNHHRSVYRRHPRATKDGRFPVLGTEEALRRIEKAKWEIHTHFKRHPDKDVLETSLRRTFDVIRKMACLFAMSEGKDYFDTSHVLISLSMVEQWLRDLETVVGMVSDNYISRACDELEAFISREGIAKSSAIYRHRKGELKFDTDKYITQLHVQGRIETLDRKPGEEPKYRIREDRTPK